MPLLCDRSVTEKYDAARLERIAASAYEQSVRVHAMSIMPAMNLATLLLQGRRGVFGEKDALDEEGQESTEVEARRVVEQWGRLRYIREERTAVIGPEGGFTKSEKQLLRHHLQPVSFSDGVLRVETAAIVGCAFLSRV